MRLMSRRLRRRLSAKEWPSSGEVSRAASDGEEEGGGRLELFISKRFFEIGCGFWKLFVCLFACFGVFERLLKGEIDANFGFFDSFEAAIRGFRFSLCLSVFFISFFGLELTLIGASCGILEGFWGASDSGNRIRSDVFWDFRGRSKFESEEIPALK